MDADDPVEQDATHDVTRGAERAERAFVEGLIARGEAAPLDEHGRLPPGATHELVEDDQGRVTARRKRFSAF